jgi:hypothetical protein
MPKSFHADIGASQLRTYGLARGIEVLQMAASGKAALPTYVLIAAAHMASGLIVYRLMQKVTGDVITAGFATVAWVAAPAVLPYVKVEHHFLYLIAPYYTLLAWVWLVLTRERVSLTLGIALLTATWWLGEGAVIPMTAAVAMLAWMRKEWRLLAQGAAAGLLLALYIGYQVLFVSDPAQHQRMTFLAPEPLLAIAAQIIECGKAILGLAHFDAEIGGEVAGTKVFKFGITYIAAIMALLAAALTLRDVNTNAQPHNPQGAVVLPAIAVLSIVVFVVMAVFRISPMAIRYTAAFYALLPLGAIAVLAATARLQTTRIAAGVIAAASIGLSVGLLYRAEMMVNRPVRALLADTEPGSAIVIRHEGWPMAADGQVSGGYPGLISVFANGFANPLRSAWTAEGALRLYANVQLGTSCRVESENRIGIYYQGRYMRSVPSDAVKAMGLPSRAHMDSAPLPLEAVCTPLP